MTLKIDLPSRADPCWLDPQWRTQKFREVKKLSGKNLKELAETYNMSHASLRHFHSGNWQQISINDLRLIILELTAG